MLRRSSASPEWPSLAPPLQWRRARAAFRAAGNSAPTKRQRDRHDIAALKSYHRNTRAIRPNANHARGVFGSGDVHALFDAAFGQQLQGAARLVASWRVLSAG